LERAHIWEHLYSVAVVIGCVRAIVATSIKSISTHLVSMVLVWQTTEGARESLFKRNLPESVLAKIPKEWNYTTLDVKEKDSVNQSRPIQALSFIFTNLPLAVASLPLSIRFLFQVAEKHLSQHARQLRSVGLLLWALLGCLIQDLDAADTSEQLSGQVLNSEAKDCFSLLAECLQAVMSIQQKVQGLEDRRPKWINMQLQKARKLCTDECSYSLAERGVASAELTEQKIGLMLLEVCHKAGGSNYLRQIYHIIQGNELLEVSTLYFSLTTLETRSLIRSVQTPKPIDAVVDWAWDWPNLLPAYGGMSQVTFRKLKISLDQICDSQALLPNLALLQVCCLNI
uniref:Uncharacterized protein n=1 Tax=Oryzias latipes TaxID=8090 RepID=A0A3P9M0R3_ORYLA